MTHTNSQAALQQITADGSRLSRRERILAVFEAHPKAHYTDRDILKILFPRSDNPGLVRPRISGLINDPPYLLEECGSVKCPVTSKTVRLVRLAGELGQLSLL